MKMIRHSAARNGGKSARTRITTIMKMKTVAIKKRKRHRLGSFANSWQLAPQWNQQPRKENYPRLFKSVNRGEFSRISLDILPNVSQNIILHRVRNTFDDILDSMFGKSFPFAPEKIAAPLLPKPNEPFEDEIGRDSDDGAYCWESDVYRYSVLEADAGISENNIFVSDSMGSNEKNPELAAVSSEQHSASNDVAENEPCRIQAIWQTILSGETPMGI